MNQIGNQKDIDRIAKKAVDALYGSNIQDFKIREIFPFPTEQKRDSWDTQVTFLRDGLQYTVDLMIDEKNEMITAARLIDTMNPL
jgi:hypothetical protein